MGLVAVDGWHELRPTLYVAEHRGGHVDVNVTIASTDI